VSASTEGKSWDFAQKTSKKGSLYSTARGVATVTARMHSGQGSKGYMSVIFETK